jgi:hypothetical protein
MFLASTVLDNEDTLLLIGLSAENRRRLADGQPIDIRRDSHGMAIPTGLHIVIFAGETEASMQRDLSTLIGPTTVVGQRKPQ